MSSLAPSQEATKLIARPVICISSPRRKGKPCASTSRDSAGCSTTSPDVHPAVVISVFHQNVRNCKMREELAMTKVKDVAELYVLADKCTQAEEGRKYPGEDTDAETNSGRICAMSSLAPSQEATKLIARPVICISSPRRKGKPCASTSRDSAGCSTTSPDVHPAVVISVFHQNVRNCKMREELAMTKVKDVAELYVLADKCTQAEEGRKYPGEDTDAETNSTNEEGPASQQETQGQGRTYRRGV